MAMCSSFSLAQTRIDSLENRLQLSLSEEEKTATQLLLAEAYLDSDLKKAATFLALIKTKLNSEENTSFILRYYIAESIYQRKTGNPKVGKRAALKALEYSVKIKDSAYYKSKIFNSLGALADDESDVKTAIDYHLQALRYAESINFEKQIATICNGLGRAYLFLSNYKQAREYFDRTVAIKLKRNEQDQHLASTYLNISNCLDGEGKFEEALLYLDKSIVLQKQYRTLSLATSYNNKAYSLFGLKRFNEAEIAVRESIALSDSLGLVTDLMYAYSTYAEILFAQNRVQKAEEFMQLSIDLSKKNNDLYLATYNLELLYNIWLHKGNYKQALNYYRQLDAVKDSVNSLRTRREVEKLSLDYETEKKNKEIAFLNAEKEVNEVSLKKSRQLQVAFLILAILALLIIGLLRSRHKNKMKTDRLLKEALEKSYEKKLSDSEMQALRAQMNPHFLFNSLNSINSFIIKNQQEEASEYLSKFSMLIRKVLSNSKEKKITLGNELEALELYIEMEALRVNNAFTYQITIGEDVEKDYLEIPPLIIQPYVENSIWHGLMHKTDGKGKLQIDIRQEKEMLFCTIKDNGIGRDAASKFKNKEGLKQKSFGMNITKERLEYINEKFKDSSNVTVTDLKNNEGQPSGTQVVIKIAISE